jgi:Ni/Co efflux regulator RcnB
VRAFRPFLLRSGDNRHPAILGSPPRKENRMTKILSGAMAGLTAIACVLSAVPAAAQNRDHRDGRGNSREWNRDRDGRGSQAGRQRDRRDYRWSRYNRQSGYNGYRGRWREGQRFNHWNNSRYYVNDWGAYNLPAPRRGYRYYRDDNGDIIMAAIGSGIIGLILGSQLGR